MKVIATKLTLLALFLLLFSGENVAMAQETGAAPVTSNLAPGEILNVGTQKSWTLRQAVSLIRQYFNISKRPHWNTYPARVWDTCVWRSNCKKILSNTDWEPTTDFESGLRRTIAWHQAVQSHSLCTKHITIPAPSTAPHMGLVE